MQTTKVFKLSLLSFSFLATMGVTQAGDSNPLVQTETAKPAPPGQVRDRDNGNGKGDGRGAERGMPGFSVIVRFKDDPAQKPEGEVRGNPSERGAAMQLRAQQMSQLSGQEISFMRSMGLARTHVFKIREDDYADSMARLPTRREKKKIFDAILSDPSVEFVEENRLHQPLQAVNDPRYSEQWHYFEAVGGVNAPAAWSDGVTGQGAVVAVLDTGYRPHTDLNANLLPGYDMISDSWMANDGDGRDSDASDPGDWVEAGACGGGRPAQQTTSSWHGTHVAGTIAAESNNSQGVAGVAYNASVVPVRVLGRCGGTTADIADGILWASGASVPGTTSNQNPADVINLSLGGQGSCQSVTQMAIDTARNNGSSVVVAAGNSDADASNFTPASCNGVISVAATNRDGGRSYYSNYGSSVTLAAPGGAQSFAGDSEGVLSTYNSGSTTPAGDSYSFSQGTSMAAPHVAGVAALLKEANPNATPNDIEQYLTSTARSFPSTCNGCGVGIIDAGAAVAAAQGGSGGDGGGTGGGGSVDDLSAATGEWNRFYIDVPSGMSTLEVRISGGTGDADLYLRQGSEPTLQSWDCRPYQYGNDEVCTISNPQAGTWNMGVHAYQAYSGVRLEVSYQP
ncbi:S8 family peptidase [Aliidiomarina sp. Khilg15.8]